MTDTDEWSFTVDEDGMVFAVAPSGVPENVRLAVETLLVPFSDSAVAVEGYLREWRRMAEEFGDDYALSTTSAQVSRVGPDEIELGDMYGQFEDCRMSAHEFERMLGQLIGFLKSLHREGESHRLITTR
ncbi:hypothetical protein ACFYY3_11085 [Streptomyces sp. NPDC001812]|uniref:Uncharacterized protein n=1 Tax=Streptomyces cathayae TaxID=3031124 RepID=A0ABY8K3P0_9ACTN|nr:hypothetical protein [Streptomyces sp. HUAS 5]WGD40912.1 hypothetical protein PYS65_12535 [Streptomyces sp. HUAS 5]